MPWCYLRSFVLRNSFRPGIWAAEQRLRRQCHDVSKAAALEALAGWVWSAQN